MWLQGSGERVGSTPTVSSMRAIKGVDGEHIIEVLKDSALLVSYLLKQINHTS